MNNDELTHHTIELNDIKISNRLPLTLISGPCQLESLEHSMMIAEKLIKICADNDINFNNQYNVNIKDQISEIVRRCNAILTQECNDFEKLSGRDIDTFYISKNKFLDIKINENFFFTKEEKGHLDFL